MRAHSDSRPKPLAAFTLQQFNSGVPSRAWNTICCALAIRTLRRLSSDPDERVALQAGQALGEAGTEECSAVLKGLLAGRTVPEIEWAWQDRLEEFLQRRSRVLLY